VTLVDLPIADLLQAPIEHGRAQLDQARVAHYMERIDETEPVTVFDTDDGLLMADGYHRLEAARRLRRTTVRAYVRKGTPHDALQFAVENAEQKTDMTVSEALAAIYRRGRGGAT